MITIEREPFLAALRVAAPVADPKSPIMACQNILIRSADGCLSLSAHSTPSQISIIVDAKGELDLTLPAKQLLDVVDAAKGDVISVADTGEVKSGRSTWKLPKLRSDDFPRLPLPPDGEWVGVVGNDLIDNPSTHPAYQLDVKDAIREAREEMAGIDDLNFRFDGASADLSAADDEIDELKGKLTSQAAEIANLKAEISRLKLCQKTAEEL